MIINEIIQTLENKINYLERQKNSYFSIGDLDQVIKLDNEILEVRAIIEKLKS